MSEELIQRNLIDSPEKMGDRSNNLKSTKVSKTNS